MRSAFSVQRLAFIVYRSAFSVWRRLAYLFQPGFGFVFFLFYFFTSVSLCEFSVNLSRILGTFPNSRDACVIALKQGDAIAIGKVPYRPTPLGFSLSAWFWFFFCFFTSVSLCDSSVNLRVIALKPWEDAS